MTEDDFERAVEMNPAIPAEAPEMLPQGRRSIDMDFRREMGAAHEGVQCSNCMGVFERPFAVGGVTVRGHRPGVDCKPVRRKKEGK